MIEKNPRPVGLKGRLCQRRAQPWKWADGFCLRSCRDRSPSRFGEPPLQGDVREQPEGGLRLVGLVRTAVSDGGLGQGQPYDGLVVCGTS